MSDPAAPSAGELLDILLGSQLSETEATDLFTDGLNEYRTARDSSVDEITLTSPLITPRAWWLVA
ncbi:MAG: hypothetical protein BWK73_04860 [Thiothrix lacustris]|uniref:Uncharacterized protein n=1 Tax=Thiothrix lacustris TaxID=525917 RepID=A0A1Y1QXN7_9GAMM|nr:MAG: hypothetical protein BWK73_04860 [Thiothrix lacustris]